MKNPVLVSATIVLGVVSLLCSQGALASDSEAQLRYRSDKAACLSGTSSQERGSCLKEAAAALAEARRGQLSSGDLESNSLARCAALPASDRDDCRQRVQGGATSGSVAGGGILREYSRPAN